MKYNSCESVLNIKCMKLRIRLKRIVSSAVKIFLSSKWRLPLTIVLIFVKRGRRIFLFFCKDLDEIAEKTNIYNYAN